MHTLKSINPDSKAGVQNVNKTNAKIRSFHKLRFYSNTSNTNKCLKAWKWTVWRKIWVHFEFDGRNMWPCVRMQLCSPGLPVYSDRGEELPVNWWKSTARPLLCGGCVQQLRHCTDTRWFLYKSLCLFFLLIAPRWSNGIVLFLDLKYEDIDSADL